MNSLRQYTVKQFSTIFNVPETHTICLNLEKSIHNWTYRKTLEANQEAAYDNPKHASRYKHKFLEIQRALKNNDELKQEILNGKLKTPQVVNLAPQHLWPSGLYDEALKKSLKKDMEKEYDLVRDENYVGLFQCKKCRKNKTTYYEMQTRSADEPMTVFVTCHMCNSTWKM